MLCASDRGAPQADSVKCAFLHEHFWADAACHHRFYGGAAMQKNQFDGKARPRSWVMPSPSSRAPQAALRRRGGTRSSLIALGSGAKDYSAIQWFQSNPEALLAMPALTL